MRVKSEFKLDISEFQYYFRPYELSVFDIKKYAKKEDLPFYINWSSKNKYWGLIFIQIQWILKRFDKDFHLEKQFNFDENFLHIKSWYFEWFFQSEKYFKDFEKEIRQDFEFLIQPSKENKKMIEKITHCESVSLHIRRWDYISNPTANAFHGTCNLGYYQKAVDLIKSKVENPVFFLFSDDMDWVKENLKIEDTSYYIDWNTDNKSYEDMRLMSLCNHNIIANSSFSWWWAWLNQNPDKIVIAPSRWFTSNKMNYSDIVPDSWVKIV